MDEVHQTVPGLLVGLHNAIQGVEFELETWSEPLFFRVGFWLKVEGVERFLIIDRVNIQPIPWGGRLRDLGDLAFRLEIVDMAKGRTGYFAPMARPTRFQRGWVI